MNDGVEGALQKRRVDGAERFVSFDGHAGCEQNGVLLGNTHIEIALGMVRAKQIESGPVRHGRSNGDDLVIHVRQFDHGFAEDFGISFLRGGLGLSGGRIVGPKPMELLLLR